MDLITTLQQIPARLGQGLLLALVLAVAFSVAWIGLQDFLRANAKATWKKY